MLKKNVSYSLYVVTSDVLRMCFLKHIITKSILTIRTYVGRGRVI